MSAPNDGGPAFPGFGEVFTTSAAGDTGPQSLWGMEGAKGMSLRDYFAAQAVPALVPIAREHAWRAGELGKIAYWIADDLLAARELCRERERSR